VLGLRCASYGYQYGEIVGSLSSVYFCGGGCVEDVTSHLMPHLSLHPTLRTCSSDTILRGISELATSNTSYTSDTGKSYDSENTVFLLLTALIRNFYKFLMDRLDTKAFGLKKTSRIKAFVFKFISVPTKWIRTARHYELNIYTHNKSYQAPFEHKAPVMPDGVRGRWALPIHNHVCSGKAIVRWRGKLQNVVNITICCGF